MKIAVPTLFSLSALLFPLSAASQPQTLNPAKPPPVCLRQDMVWGWQVVNNQTLIVTDRVQRKYKVSLKPGCLELKWPMHLAFKSFSGFGLSCLTRNDYLIVPPEAGLPSQRCYISDIAAYLPPPK